MDKRKVISIVIILILSITIYKLDMNKVNKIKEVDKVQVIDTKEENNIFAFMIQGADGKYTQSQNNTWPGEGYKLNTNNTKCMDNNGVEVKNGITYNASSKIVTVTSSNTSYCYLYFDLAGKGGLEILESLPASSGLSTSTLGDMRRYQGTDVKNYICINDTGAKCNSGSDEMYRIIGIVDSGDEAGQIKVMKEISYGKYNWHKTASPSSCSGTTCSWPNSSLVKTLNSTFLNNLPQKVQENIVSRQWYYGDLHYDYANITADKMYQIETGQINTTYYDMSSGNKVSNQKWQKTSTELKVGLIYIHDYAYAANSHSTSCKTNYDACKTIWMRITQNGGSTSDDEWTMSRSGRDIITPEIIFAWIINRVGPIHSNSLELSNVVRPVFYLSSDVKIKSGGTGEKTNPYILDLS